MEHEPLKLLDYKHIDPDLRPILDSLPNLNINRDNLQEIRQVMGAGNPPAPVVVQQEVVELKTADADIRLHVYRKTDRPNQPAVLWIHGGGYILGTAEDNRAPIIADYCDCTVASVDYRLAPECPFPAALDDCCAALQWLLGESEHRAIDPDRIAIAGASAGAGLTAALALINRDGENFPLRMQMLLYPMLDNLHATTSGRYQNHPVWNRETSLNAWEMYLDGVPGESASPYAAPARARDLSELPAAYICVGAADLFRDECIDYARRLIASGVPCELTVFPGLYHAGDSFVPEAAVSQRLQQSFLAAIADALA